MIRFLPNHQVATTIRSQLQENHPELLVGKRGHSVRAVIKVCKRLLVHFAVLMDRSFFRSLDQGPHMNHYNKCCCDWPWQPLVAKSKLPFHHPSVISRLLLSGSCRASVATSSFNSSYFLGEFECTNERGQMHHGKWKGYLHWKGQLLRMFEARKEKGGCISDAYRK